MASPNLSLGSLSSPSPSPSPQPSPQLPHINATAHTEAPGAHPPASFRPIDTDSELSELTDDDQDASTAAEKRAASIATASSSKAKGGAAIADDDDPSSAHDGALVGSPLRMAMRGVNRPPNSSRRGAGRKKRSSIVPAPMWGWVPEKTSTSAAVVEEEEEEISGPPRAMEEEEDEEDEDEGEEEGDVGDDYDAYDHGDDSGEAEVDANNRPSFGTHRRQGSYQSKRLPKSIPRRTRAPNSSAPRRTARKYDDDYEDEDPEEDNLKAEKRPRQPPAAKRVPPKHENGDDRPIANGEDDEGSASGGSEYLSTKRKKQARPRLPASAPRRRKDNGNDDSTGSDVPVSSRKKNGVKPQHEDPEDEDPATASHGEDDNTDSEADPPPNTSGLPSPLSPSRLTGHKPIVPSTTANSSAALSALAALANAVDPTMPPAREIASINAAAASASIMAGAASSVQVVSQSGTTSEAGTRDPSPSRSTTPTARTAAEDSEDDGKASKSKPKGGKAAPRAGKSKPRGKPLVPDKRDPSATTNDDPPKTTNATKKGPPAPLDLKADTLASGVVAANGEDMDIDEEANEHSMEDPDVEMDASEHEHDDDEDDNEGETHEEDEDIEEHEHADEETVDPDQEGEGDGEEEANDGEDDGVDQEGDGVDDEEQDQEQDNEQDNAEAQQDNEEGEEEVDNDEEHASQNGDADADVDVEDHESDLQPAHRAEALDVLATIELKFALLRERVYVEKMEALAWEEMLVQNAIHPELQHLQKELSKRRDKRLELASRKRSYEVANAVTRRNTDESNIWSWWMFTRDDLQTEMIAETSRKRRKLERERRAIERPQPIRRIPHPMDVMNPPLPPPSLRKIIKSYPFGSRKHNKADTHHHHHRHSHHHSHYPKNLVYPEISTLSASDIQSDLDFLSQNRRNSGFDQHQPQPLPHQPHYPLQMPRNGSMMGGIGRPIMQNGMPPPMQAQPPQMGPPPGPMMHPQHHGMGYEPYGDIAPTFGPSGAPGRVRDQYGPSGPPGSSRDGMNAYSNYPPGPSGRPPPGMPMSMAHHGYPGEHEMSTMAPSPNNGGGHQILPNHPYFGQGSMGPGAGGSSHGPPPSSSHMSAHHPGSSGMKTGMGMNGRRSVSPVHGMNGGVGPKTNGGWMGMGNFQGAGGVGKGGGDWIHEDEERERVVRERDMRDRKRDEREKEKEQQQQQRDREMDRARREREYNDQERDRQREHQHLHRQPSIHGSSSHSHLPHLHGSNAGGPPPSGPAANHPHSHNHHHHRMHHHHVLHNHHPQQPQHASSMPLTDAAPPITHSPRSTREYGSSRPPLQGPMHSGPGQVHPTELIMLSSDNKRQPSGHWPNKLTDEREPPPPPLHSSIVDYRDRDRDIMTRERNERDARKMHSGRHSTGPAMPPLEDRGDRPMAMPFVMASSHTMQQTAAGISSGSHINGSGLSSSTSSPRGAPPSWNAPGGMDDSYRVSSSAPPPSGYMGSPHDAHMRSPVQGHRYAASSGGHAPTPLGGRIGNSSSTSGIHHRMASPPLPPPGRSRPPQSPSYPPAPTAHRSPVTSPKMRTLSPVPSTSKHNLSGPLPGPGYSSSPHLSGPGRTLTPTGHHPPPPLSSGPASSMQDAVMKNGALPPFNGSSRTASPLMSSLQGSGRPTANGANGDRDRNDRDRDRLSPRLGAPSVPLAPPPSKLSTAQT
ncbi:hypothetical protein BDN70DRAFT_870920 [Pholiota conissans]|uniref:Sds3-like-domain-containing protein n=1 Tax=Pholiota conissans TaxID=109636 RepID=A0A9P5ZEF0_9AGAR|nr:hypothetical protein BDN70DRAFT_870920 [Pholiota conissans]